MPCRTRVGDTWHMGGPSVMPSSLTLIEWMQVGHGEHMALVLPCVKVVGVRCPTPMSNQFWWFEGENGSWSREVKRRRRKKGKEERRKERKRRKKKMKEKKK